MPRNRPAVPAGVLEEKSTFRIRRLADKSAGEGPPWPSVGVTVLEAPPAHEFDMRWCLDAEREGWLELTNKREVVVWAAPDGRPHPSPYVFVEADGIRIRAEEGEYVYRVLRQPGQHLKPIHDAERSGLEIEYRIDWFYLAELVRGPLPPISGAANGIFNISLGRFAYYATLPAAADALVVVILQTTGLQADATLRDHDDLAALLAATNDEPTNTGYARKTVTSVTVTVDDTNERVDVDHADQTWTAVAAGTNWAKLLECYDDDTGAGTDANIRPLSFHDFSVTPDGSDITAVYDAAGIMRAS